MNLPWQNPLKDLLFLLLHFFLLNAPHAIQTKPLHIYGYVHIDQNMFQFKTMHVYIKVKHLNGSFISRAFFLLFCNFLIRFLYTKKAEINASIHSFSLLSLPKQCYK